MSLAPSSAAACCASPPPSWTGQQAQQAQQGDWRGRMRWISSLKLRRRRRRRTRRGQAKRRRHPGSLRLQRPRWVDGLGWGAGGLVVAERSLPCCLPTEVCRAAHPTSPSTHAPIVLCALLCTCLAACRPAAASSRSPAAASCCRRPPAGCASLAACRCWLLLVVGRWPGGQVPLLAGAPAPASLPPSHKHPNPGNVPP